MRHPFLLVIKPNRGLLAITERELADIALRAKVRTSSQATLSMIEARSWKNVLTYFGTAIDLSQVVESRFFSVLPIHLTRSANSVKLGCY